MVSTEYEERRKRQTKKAWKWIIIFLISLFIFSVVGRYLWGIIGFHIVYGEGDRVGQIVKLSDRGLIWKTWETGMGITQSGAYVQYWDFSIDSQNPNKEKIIQDLRRAYNSGEIVKVHYVQRYGVLPWRADTTYLVQNIEFIRS